MMTEHADDNEATPQELARSLDQAAQGEDASAVRALCERGAAVAVRHGQFALKRANWREIMEVLLEHGFDVNTQTSRQRPFLSLALDDEAQLRFLLEHGADPNGESPRWKARLLDTCAAVSTVASFQTLVAFGARIDRANPLHSAAATVDDDDDSRIPMMTYLLDECRLDVNAVSHFGHRPNTRTGDEDGTPLQAAIRVAADAHIRFLLRRGADPAVQSSGGDDAFEYARRNGLSEGLELLQRALAEERPNGSKSD